VKILDAWKPVEFGELVIMGGEERSGAAAGMNVFDDSPGYGEAVISRRPPTNLIEQDERARRGGVEDRCSLGHLNHEGGATAGQIVRGSNPGENPVHQWQSGRSCRHKA